MNEQCNISNLYCTEKIDFTKEPIFFGSGKNTQRFDIVKYQFFDNNNEKQLSFFWRPDEVKLNKDKQHFAKMAEHEKWILTKVLQKLIFLDSLQGRGPMLTFAQITTLPEFENVILTWDFFEGSIHSRSYSHLLQNVYPEPDKIFDSTFEIDILMEHAKDISSYYNRLYNLVILYQFYKNERKLTDKIRKNLEYKFKQKLDKYDISNEDKDRLLLDFIETIEEVFDGYSIDDDKVFMKEIKKSIILAFVNVNILEGIRFYSGFASVWALTEGQGLVPGSSKILKLICRDENVHLALTQNTLKILRDKEEGFSDIFNTLEDKIYEMYRVAIEQEFDWADYLYSKGSVIGLNSLLIKDYLRYICNKRLKSIGLKPIFDGYSKNPLPWINHWIKESVVEGTPQELELDSYVSGAIDNSDDIDSDDIEEFKDMVEE